MASLKSFLFGVAPVIGITGAALYERQRALVSLGLLKTTVGRGPGSGVPFSAQNFAAVLISVLAARSLSEVDQYVVDLCKATPDGTLPFGPGRRYWEKLGKPTFLTDVGRVLAGENTLWRHGESDRKHRFFGIRATRPWRGQIVDSPTGARPIAYFPDDADKYMVGKSIVNTSEIESDLFEKLVTFTKGALSQIDTDERTNEGAYPRTLAGPLGHRH
jgi:hypothetical protein